MNEYKLGDICSIGSSKRIHLSDYVDFGVPFYRSKEIIELSNGKEINNELFISNQRFNEIRDKYPVPKLDDILITAVGTIGVSYLVKDQNFYFKDGNLIWLRNIDKTIVDVKFLYKWLKSTFFVNQILNNNIGAVQKAITIDYLKKVNLSLPKIEIQKQIASVLSALDDKIELNNKINSELEAMAKTLYDYWFVQFDFPNAEGKPYKSSGGEMVYDEVLKREIPKGWEVGNLANLAYFNPSLSIMKNVVSPYLDMRSLPTTGYMTQSPELKPFEGGVKFQNGDVLVARITPCLENGKTALVTMLEIDSIGFGSTEFINMRSKSKGSISFLAILSRSEFFRSYIISRMVGTSGRKRVEAKALSNYVLPIPPQNVLGNFGKAVDCFFLKMTTNQKQNQELASLRDWSLPMLMNGQVKVVEAYKEVEEKLGMVAEGETAYNLNRNEL